MFGLYDQWLAELGFELRTSRVVIERGGHISLWHAEVKQISVIRKDYEKIDQRETRVT